MSLILSGTDGLSDVDGSAATPAIRGTDTNTGIFFPAADTIGFAEGGVEVMRITSAGDVGIGTASPSTKLHVETSSTGDAFKVAKGGNYLIMGGSGSGTQYVKGYEGVVAFGNAFAGATAFLTGDTERMRIDSSGNLLVNTTSNSLSTKLFVSGSIGSQQTYGPMYYSNENNTDNVGRGSFNFQRGGSTVGQIVTTNSTCAYNSVSDYRLKENIAPMIGALGKVAQLKPCTFTWKSNSFIGQGFIAHELQEVVPDCVAGEKDAVDAEGKPVYQGVDTSFLVATLTAAIQEQQALITALTARITALETP